MNEIVRFVDQIIEEKTMMRRAQPRRSIWNAFFQRLVRFFTITN